MDNLSVSNMSSNILDSFLEGLPSFSSLSPVSIIVTLTIVAAPFIMLFILAFTQQEKSTAPPAGCRKLGIKMKSNLSDQYASKYSHGTDPRDWKVKALFIYPVTSCVGVELDQADIIRTGFRYDRQFCFAQQSTGLPSPEGKVESTWNFITQRTFARLTKVESEIWVPDRDAPDYDPEAEFVKSEGCLVMRFPFSPDVDFSLEGVRNLGKIVAAKWAGTQEPMVEFRVPFDPSPERIASKAYTKEKIKIWKDAPEALNMGCEVLDETMAKLKYTLGVANPLTLFRIDTNNYREMYKYAPKQEDVGFQPIIGMADSYPIHINNLASIHQIAAHLPSPYPKRLSALRYRANIFITGPPAFNEDSWTKARVGECILRVSCRTTRCKLPNVDPETGERDRNEPDATMRKFRVIDEGSESACLGMQCTPLGHGIVKVGDKVKVLEEGKHFYLTK